MELLNSTQFKLFPYIKNLLNPSITIFKSIIDFFHYQSELNKNFYPCSLINEFTLDKKGNTIIKYKTFGHRCDFSIKLHDLFLDKQLLEKFHPIEISKITFLAFGEIFFSIPENERITKFNQIKEKILKNHN